MQNAKNKNFIPALLSLVVVVLILSAAAIVRDGRIFGIDLRHAHTMTDAVALGNDTMSVHPDGTIVVDTRLLAKDVQGYGGPVPLRIHVSKSGVVDSIVAEPNAESPDFFNHASAILAQWQGKTVDEAAAMEVDGVTGATFSSRAIITNVQRGLAYAKQHAALGNAPDATGSVDVSGASASSGGFTLGGFDSGVDGCCGSAVCQEPPLALCAAVSQRHCAGLVDRHVRVVHSAYATLLGGRKPCHARHARRSVAYGSGGYALSSRRSTRTLLRPRVPVRLGSGACRQTHPSQTAALATLEQSAQRVPQRSVGSPYGAHAHRYLDRMDGL